MSRLIDAEALIKDVLDLQDCPNGFSDTYDKACIIGVIDEQPTVAPKRGKWTITPLYIKCSECGESFMLIPQNYCPNCGAKMGEENAD